MTAIVPKTSWSFGTQAFRREEGEWRLLHRHADSLMHKHAPV